MQDEPAWRAMYAAGDRLYADAGVPPRLLLWLGAMAALFATVAAWWTAGLARRRLVVIALAGRAVSGVAIWLLALAGGAIEGTAHGWLYVLLAALAIEAIGWLWTWRVPDGPGLSIVTGAGTAALLAGTVVREAPRLAILEPPRAAALGASGVPVFVLTAVLGVIVVIWIVRDVVGATRGR